MLELRKTRIPWKTWAAQGVEVLRLESYTLQDVERETALSWLHKDKMVEVTTTDMKWQARLEFLECVPFSISVYSNGEMRYYRNVPKRFIKLPSDGSKRKKSD